MYFGAEHLIGFLIVCPSAQWYSYLGPADMMGHRSSVQNSVIVPYNMLIWLKKSTVLTATHSSTSSPSGSWTAKRRFPNWQKGKCDRLLHICTIFSYLNPMLHWRASSDHAGGILPECFSWAWMSWKSDCHCRRKRGNFTTPAFYLFWQIKTYKLKDRIKLMVMGWSSSVT